MKQLDAGERLAAERGQGSLALGIGVVGGR